MIRETVTGEGNLSGRSKGHHTIYPTGQGDYDRTRLSSHMGCVGKTVMKKERRSIKNGKED
jgi:hypothetical protein